jgi:predicted AAA+ superfamily ATPase
LGVSSPAVERYIDLLVDLQLVRRLRPWSGNVGKRLVKAPKVYVRDSGILHALLELEDLDEVISHPVCGSSFEGYCIENLLLSAGERRQPYFYRTHTGAEIDLLFEKGGTPEIAIEIKRSMSPSPDKGFAMACDELGITKRFVVYPGYESFGLRHGAQALGLDCHKYNDRSLVGAGSAASAGRSQWATATGAIFRSSPICCLKNPTAGDCGGRHRFCR